MNLYGFELSFQYYNTEMGVGVILTELTYTNHSRHIIKLCAIFIIFGLWDLFDLKREKLGCTDKWILKYFS